MIEQLVALTRVRLSLFLREPEALFWVFGFPVLVAIVLAFAFREGELPPSRVLVLDGPGATELVERLASLELLEAELATDGAAARTDLFVGRVDALVEARADAEPRLTLDLQRPEAETARLRVLLALDEDAGRDRRVAIEPVEEPGSRYVDFLLPGLIGLNLMGNGMWTIGFSIAEMRQKKLLRRMLVTPMSRPVFLASFLTARGAFLVAEVVVLTTFGMWALGVPFRGSWSGYVVLTVLGGTTFAGLGLLATARATTIQGASGLLNLAMMPMWLLSGVFFSYERFPEALQPAIRLLPLTALNDSVRGLMLEGASLVELGQELGVMAFWGAVSFAVAVRIFRWE